MAARPDTAEVAEGVATVNTRVNAPSAGVPLQPHTPDLCWHGND